MIATKTDVLDMLIRHELVIKELYEIFTVRFPDYQDLWKRLARDEQRHADLLETLRSSSDLYNWLLLDNRLKLQAVRASIGYVESQIIKAREGRFTLVQALTVARDLEAALLEKQLEKLGESHAAEIRAVVSALFAETAGHREALSRALDSQTAKAS
jgi:rubrerythrin